MTAQQKMARKIGLRSTDSLKEMAVALSADLSAEASIVLNAIMDALMGRLPEAEFVAFCEQLDG